MFFSLLVVNIIIISIVFTPVVNTLYGILEVNPKIKKADAIILLASEHFHTDLFGRNTYQRLFHAFNLYKQGYAPKIITSGGLVQVGSSSAPAVTVAEAMAKMLQEIGVDADDIIIEGESHNTYESIGMVNKLLQDMHAQHALLVTSSYHMFRSMSIAAKQGINVYPAPVTCYEKSIKHPIIRLRFTAEVIRELGAIVYFKMRGWI